MKAALCLLLCTLACAEEAEGILREKSEAEELEEISYLMQSMATDLRNDEYNTRVQLDGKEIEERLAKLEKEIESREARERIRAASGKRGVGSVLRRDAEASAERKVSGRVQNWRALAIEACEGSHGYQEEIPVRWMKRIEAYFASVAAADK